MYGDLDRDKPRYVARMFAAIAPRYDLMNRIMTLGRDVAWRRRVARELRLPPHGAALDVAAGTGDIAREIARLHPQSQVVALDFCMDMMLVGWRKFSPDERVAFVCGDAMALPYPDGSFDGVATGFALRNVADIARTLREMWRVLKPGGRMACLEVSRPPQWLISNIYWWYFFRVVPTLGGLISGQREAYAYLPQSARAFLSAEELAEEMKAVGFVNVRFHHLMLGAAAVHVGEKQSLNKLSCQTCRPARR